MSRTMFIVMICFGTLLAAGEVGLRVSLDSALKEVVTKKVEVTHNLLIQLPNSRGTVYMFRDKTPLRQGVYKTPRYKFL